MRDAAARNHPELIHLKQNEKKIRPNLGAARRQLRSSWRASKCREYRRPQLSFRPHLQMES